MFLYVPSQRDWSDHIYVKGCIAALEDWLPGNLYTVAIIFIVISLLQVQTLQFSTVLHPPGVCVLVCVCWCVCAGVCAGPSLLLTVPGMCVYLYRWWGSTWPGL